MKPFSYDHRNSEGRNKFCRLRISLNPGTIWDFLQIYYQETSGYFKIMMYIPLDPYAL